MQRNIQDQKDQHQISEVQKGEELKEELKEELQREVSKEDKEIQILGNKNENY